MANSTEHDLIFGAGKIAQIVFGSDTPSTRRSIFHMAQNGQLPINKIGGRLAASRLRLVATIAGEGQKDER